MSVVLVSFSTYLYFPCFGSCSILTDFWRNNLKCRNKNRHVGQWNRIQSPLLNLGICGQLRVNKRAKNTQWGQDSPFNKWCWESWMSKCRTMELNLCLTRLTKICLKWIRIRHETWYCKTPRRKCRKVSSHCLSKDFFGYNTKNTNEKRKTIIMTTSNLKASAQQKNKNSN